MSRSKSIWSRIAATLFVLLVLSYSPTAVACPPFERYQVYYDNCIDRNEIGYIDRDCSCGTVSGGVTNGLYRIDHFYDCDLHDEYNTIYYGRCNPGDPWTQLPDETSCPNWC
jgi:hypothetical protein